MFDKRKWNFCTPDWGVLY